MKILVTGSRYWTDRDYIKYELLDYLERFPDVVFIQGGARGVDSLVSEICKELKIECREYKAEWDKYGKRAGVLRNMQMLDQENPDMVLAFHEDLFGSSKGTLHMVQYALSKNVPVTIIPSSEDGG